MVVAPAAGKTFLLRSRLWPQRLLPMFAPSFPSKELLQGVGGTYRVSIRASSGPTRFNPKPKQIKQYEPLQYQKKEDPDSAGTHIWHQERLKLSGIHKEEETTVEGEAELEKKTEHSFAQQELIRLQQQLRGKEHSKPELLHTLQSAVTEEEDGEEAGGGGDFEYSHPATRFQKGIAAASIVELSSAAKCPSSQPKREESMKQIAFSNVFYGDGRKFEGLPLDDLTTVVGELGHGHLDMDQLSEEDKVRMKEKSTAKNYSIRLLATAPQTAAKLRLKMASKSISSDIIESTIADLQRCGLQCDLDYAEGFARSRWRAASWGPQRLKLELRKRGVAQDDVEKALHKVFQSQELGNREEDEDEEGRWGMTKDASEHLLLQARRQWGRGGNISNEARKRRMIGWLQRRGFSWSVISEILKSLEK
ncbi:unnamed protein product [Sphagnum jensenii]|uniref:Regulatory protein RecX n=1 Tax=Sphagnum jensenii TaxID=128206 RepID=A0ABP1B845_9BRYO